MSEMTIQIQHLGIRDARHCWLTISGTTPHTYQAHIAIEGLSS